MGLTAAAEWVIGALLTRGSVTAAAINAAASQDIDVDCGGDSKLSVRANMTATAAADLQLQVFPFESDNTTVDVGLPLDPTESDGPVLSAGNALAFQSYDVTGYAKVRIRVSNKNAGAQTINRLSWRLA